MANLIPKSKLIQLIEMDFTTLHTYICSMAWNKYLGSSAAYGAIREAGSWSDARFNALHLLTFGSKVPSPAISSLTFEYYGKEYIVKRDMTHQKGDIKVEQTDDVKVEEMVGKLLQTIGKKSYGGGDPEAIDKLKEQHTNTIKAKDKANNKLAEDYLTAKNKLEDAKKSEESMREKLEEVINKPTVSLEPVVGDGTIPDGSIVMKKVSEVFPSVVWSKDFEVPVWEWDGVHPDIDTVDENYIFREEELTRVLYAILTNQRCYLQGHTGTGKTTLVEQTAARLNWPTLRVNLDSEISRFDLMGRETLKVDGGGATYSRFDEGILPRMLSGPYIGIFDEIDFVRPDVAYTMQPIFEGGNLVVLEDGGRVIHPDPNFRMFATGNTVGQGDEMGMYQGARPQSLAMLDRFTVWIKVEYLTDEQRLSLIQKASPTLGLSTAKNLNKYVREHLAAFTQGDVLQPISPRGFLSIAKACTVLTGMNCASQEANLKQALTMAVLDRATETDRRTLTELVQRTTR